MTIDISGWSFQNLWLSRAGELVVRPAFYEEIDSREFGEYELFVAGFSVRSPNTGEVTHYLFHRHRNTGICTLRLTDEEFRTRQTLSLGPVPRRLVVTHALVGSAHVSSLELIIAGPDIPTLYGFAGSGVTIAEAQPSGDPNRTSIDIPRGICAGFAGRAVIANGKNLYFSDTYGTRVVDGEAIFTGPRTYTAVNIGDMGGTIYGLHVVDDGALFVVTDRGVWGLAPEAVTAGVQVRDLFNLVSTYGATDYQQTSLSRGVVYGLSALGIVRASVQSAPEIALDEPRYPRSISKPVEVGDYRSLRLWSWERGLAVSQPSAVCLIDESRGQVSWQVPPPNHNVEIVGVLEGRDGESLFVTAERVFSFYGNDEFGGETVVGVACGQVKVPPEGSYVVRFVTTSSDSPGDQKAAVRGSKVRSKKTPQRPPVIGVDAWSTTKKYEERAIRSRRHGFSVRTDDVTVEVAAEHSGSRLSLVDVEVRGQGRRRP